MGERAKEGLERGGVESGGMSVQKEREERVW